MQVSFFDYDSTIGTYRWIVLSDDSPAIEAFTSSQHEEGWSSTWLRWSLDSDTGIVTCEWCDDGRDCDGRLTTHGAAWCPVADLAARDIYTDGDAEASASGPLPFRVPEWREGKRSQRDYAAEAAGY